MVGNLLKRFSGLDKTIALFMLRYTHEHIPVQTLRHA